MNSCPRPSTAHEVVSKLLKLFAGSERSYTVKCSVTVHSRLTGLFELCLCASGRSARFHTLPNASVQQKYFSSLDDDGLPPWVLPSHVDNPVGLSLMPYCLGQHWLSEQKYFKGPLFSCQAASSAIESNSAATGRNFDPLLHVQNTHVTV